MWGLVLLGGLVALGVGRRSTPADNPAYDALAKAHTRRMVADSVAKDSLTRLAGQRQVVFVAAKKRATDAVEQLPPAKIVGATLSLPAGDFVLPLPVIGYIVELRHTVAVQSTAITAATDALDASERARAAGDSVSAGLTLDRDRWKLEAESRRPSRWRTALPYVAFVAGAYIGSRVTR